nr:DEAD/DEAH box helicase family protein [Corynebacterium cystitidis]
MPDTGFDGYHIQLADQEIDTKIAGRDYQMSMIRAVTERFDNEGHRRALLVMATGTGKTRVAIALTKLMRGAKWAKQILFLADRKRWRTWLRKCLPRTCSGCAKALVVATACPRLSAD